MKPNEPQELNPSDTSPLSNDVKISRPSQFTDEKIKTGSIITVAIAVASLLVSLFALYINSNNDFISERFTHLNILQKKEIFWGGLDKFSEKSNDYLRRIYELNLVLSNESAKAFKAAGILEKHKNFINLYKYNLSINKIVNVNEQIFSIYEQINQNYFSTVLEYNDLAEAMKVKRWKKFSSLTTKTFKWSANMEIILLEYDEKVGLVTRPDYKMNLKQWGLHVMQRLFKLNALVMVNRQVPYEKALQSMYFSNLGMLPFKKSSKKS